VTDFFCQDRPLTLAIRFLIPHVYIIKGLMLRIDLFRDNILISQKGGRNFFRKIKGFLKVL